MRFIGVLFLLPIVVFAASVVETFDAPDTGITGLAYDGGSLWAVDGTTQYVYEINPSNGSVISSFYVTDQTANYNPVPGGLACSGGTLFLTMHSGTQYGEVYKYNTSGVLQGQFDIYC